MICKVSDPYYTDSSVAAGEIYYFRLFASDRELNYTESLSITITINGDGLSAVEAPVLKSVEQLNYYSLLPITVTISTLRVRICGQF